MCNISRCLQYALFSMCFELADWLLFSTGLSFALFDYKDISLLSIVYKSYPPILSEKVNILYESQNGFRKARACIDAICLKLYSINYLFLLKAEFHIKRGHWPRVEEDGQSNTCAWPTLTSDFPLLQGAKQNSHCYSSVPQRPSVCTSYANPPTLIVSESFW